MPPKRIRVRIAPSPTGFMHIGTARTALINYVWAKKNNGNFILRIEDTDTERSTKEFEKSIFDGLRWLGLDWDEGPADSLQVKGIRYKEDTDSYGPYRQSERTEIYKKHLEQLLKESRAYYCYCSEEELKSVRDLLLAEGKAMRYNGKCRILTGEDIRDKQESRESSVIRFKMPDEKITFNDAVRGSVAFDMALTGDIVIAKDLDHALYNFAVVVDDETMGITDVIRAEDHLSNTPKQIALQRALGFTTPSYAHLPLILDMERHKMSKRNSATSLIEYRALGYLPEALINFIALLGWHPEGNQEKFTIDELIEHFTLDRVQKGGAAFNVEKLDWLNNQYIRDQDAQALYDRIVEEYGLLNNLHLDQWLKIIELTKERAHRLTDFKGFGAAIATLPEYPSELLVWKQTSKEVIKNNLEEIKKIVEQAGEQSFFRTELAQLVAPLAEARGKGEIFWPLRAALSGSKESLGPLELLDILGKAESLRRIEIAILILE